MDAYNCTRRDLEPRWKWLDYRKEQGGGRQGGERVDSDGKSFFTLWILLTILYPSR